MRLITRPDLDGLTCGVLLDVVEDIDEVVFVEPQDMQKGRVDVRSEDIVANLPYDPRCALWFDHHISNRLPEGTTFRGAFHIDPSAARTVYNYYRDPRLDRYRELLEATDRVDAALLSLDDVLHPQGYVLLSLSLDPRSNFENSDAYYHQLLEWLKVEPIDAILKHEVVAERCTRILDEQRSFEALLRRHSRIDGEVVVVDLRGIDPLPVGSRFLVYALFPDCSASVKVYPARNAPGHVGISLGHSIFKRVQKVNVGYLCARYGGGGHFGAASCSVPAGRADQVVEEVIAVLKRNEAIDSQKRPYVHT